MTRYLNPGDTMPGTSGDVVVQAFDHTVVVRSTNREVSIRTMPPGCAKPVDLLAAFAEVFGPIPDRRYDTGRPDYDVDGEPDPDPDPDGYEADRAAARMFDH